MEFEVRGIQYRAGKLDARAQFHIVRRLAPFLKALAPLAGKMKDQSQALEALPAIGEVLAELDDETADYVLFGLLSVVTRKEPQGLGWANVSKGNALMYMDITMSDMIAMAGRALMANMGDFFQSLHSASSQLGQKPSAQ